MAHRIAHHQGESVPFQIFKHAVDQKYSAILCTGTGVASHTSRHTVVPGVLGLFMRADDGHCWYSPLGALGVKAESMVAESETRVQKGHGWKTVPRRAANRH